MKNNDLAGMCILLDILQLLMRINHCEVIGLAVMYRVTDIAMLTAAYIPDDCACNNNSTIQGLGVETNT